jgi:hypothetical protein
MTMLLYAIKSLILTFKIVPGLVIFLSQLAQGLCINPQVVSLHPGIYTIVTNQIKYPGVFRVGGWDGYSSNWLLHNLSNKINIRPTGIAQIHARTDPLELHAIPSGNIAWYLKILSFPKTLPMEVPKGFWAATPWNSKIPAHGVRGLNWTRPFMQPNGIAHLCSGYALKLSESHYCKVN